MQDSFSATGTGPAPTAISEVTIEAGGFKTRCLLAGPETGEVVLLLHDAAFGGAADVTWQAIIPGLAQHYRVIAPDLLGFGQSDKVVYVDRSPYDFRNLHVLALLDSLGVKGPVHVVGSSFGGSMALHMLRDHAHRLKSVISIAGAGGGWRSDFGRKVLGAWDGTREGLAVITRTLADGSDEFDFERHLDQRMVQATAYGHYRAVMAAGLSVPSALAVKTEREPFPKVPQSDVAVLLIAGSRDPLVVPEWPEEIMPYLPSQTKALRMDAKHSPNLEIPAQTLAVILDWISKVK